MQLMVHHFLQTMILSYKEQHHLFQHNMSLKYYQRNLLLWDGFCMKFLQGLYIALWSLLLVIPGIVKTYSYAMTPYIMSEHPSLTANEAITESRRIMNGNKWRLFCLDFSFIGWELLCSVPLYAEGFLVLKYFTGSEALAISLVLLLTIPLSIGFFFVHPYEEAAWATFYRDITAAPTEPDEAY